jgi:aryl-alcohol dehydrogenase-like predicted oxidoreductase
MTNVESIQFGRTSALVTRIGFGGAPAGLTNYLDQFSPVDVSQREGVIQAIARAVEVGINYFDTAAAYGTGESRRFSVRGLPPPGFRASGTIFTWLRKLVTTKKIHVLRSSVP